MRVVAGQQTGLTSQLRPSLSWLRKNVNTEALCFMDYLLLQNYSGRNTTPACHVASVLLNARDHSPKQQRSKLEAVFFVSFFSVFLYLPVALLICSIFPSFSIKKNCKLVIFDSLKPTFMIVFGFGHMFSSSPLWRFFFFFLPCQWSVMCVHRKQFVLVDVLFKLGTLCQQIFVYLFLFPVFNCIFCIFFYLLLVFSHSSFLSFFTLVLIHLICSQRTGG